MGLSLTGNRRQWFYRLLFLLGAVLFGTGLMDIDWMIMQYHTYGADSTPTGMWNFSPDGSLALDWWSAYVFTISRIVVGALIMGYVVAKMRVKA